jgi:cell division protein FtsW
MSANTMTATQPLHQPAGYDVRLLFPALFLVGIGLVMVYSASSALAHDKFNSDYYFLKKQALFALVGIIVLVIGRHIPYRWYRLLTYPLLAASLAMLVATHFTDYGQGAGGATRWLRIGQFSFQPSEIARLALVIYLAYSMEKKGPRLKEFSVGFLPHVLVVGVFAGLILLQPDFGSVVILTALSGLMLFIGGVRLIHLLGAAATLIPIGCYFLINSPYRLKRLLGFLDPWQYAADEGYQVIHFLMAFGTGGVFGVGVGNSYQKLFYLPEPHTDFIFSVIGEELGLLGVVFIILLYGLMVWRGVGIAKHAPDPFGTFLAAGLTMCIGLQACINMGVTLGLLPTKGLTLPFLSYGGTSLLVSMASVGILMNISAARDK